MNKAATFTAITNGLRFLAEQQLANGGYLSDSLPSNHKKIAGYRYQTVFMPAVMLTCLSGVKSPVSQQICSNLAQFLLHQRGPDWSFNYWVKGTPQRKSFPYPNDLDDTFCALLGLHSYDPKLISSRTLAQVVKLLVACENQVGGPYHSWIVSNQSNTTWRDVDLAVNSNIASFLHRLNITLPRLEALFEQRIASRNFSSSYYPNDFPSLYYLARAYRGNRSPMLRQIIEQSWYESKQTPLQTSLCLSALCRLGSNQHLLETMASHIISSQTAKGSWPKDAFCLDPSRDSQKFYGGAAALTTAFALEALQSLPKQPPQLGVRRPKIVRDNDRLFSQVELSTKQELTQYGTHVEQAALATMKRLLSSDVGHEITLLPHKFAQSWQAVSHSCPPNTFIELGMANLLGWMAYTAYDNLMDGEDKPTLLPMANVCLRGSLSHFNKSFGQDQALRAYIEQVFDQIDEANAWELANCRFPVNSRTIWLGKLPHYDDRMVLANRSLGHVLGPIGAVTLMGQPLASPALQAVELGFRHYLIARQLQDDLHDWQNDVKRGQISYVVAEILREVGASGQQTIAQLLPSMQRQFWHHSLSNLCDVVDYHTRQSHSLLERSHCLAPVNVMTGLLDKLQQTTIKSRRSQAEARGFIDGYSYSTAPRILTLP